MTESCTWISSPDMAKHLGISSRTLFCYRQRDDLFIEGRHYRRKSPAPNSPWVWSVELTDKAWAAEVAS